MTANPGQSDLGPLTEAEVAELRRLLEKATPLPWVYEDGEVHHPYMFNGSMTAHLVCAAFEVGQSDPENGPLVAAAINALPRLLASARSPAVIQESWRTEIDRSPEGGEVEEAGASCPVAVCETCNGRGEIGGFDRGDNAWRTEPCPECASRPVGGEEIARLASELETEATRRMSLYGNADDADDTMNRVAGELRSLLSGSEAAGDGWRPPKGWKLVPEESTEEQDMAARGLIMMDRFGGPSEGYTLGQHAESGFYGEYWGHLLSDEERKISVRLSKGGLANLIYRAMVAAAPTPSGVQEQGGGS